MPRAHGSAPAAGALRTGRTVHITRGTNFIRISIQFRPTVLEDQGQPHMWCCQRRRGQLGAISHFCDLKFRFPASNCQIARRGGSFLPKSGNTAASGKMPAEAKTTCSNMLGVFVESKCAMWVLSCELGECFCRAEKSSQTLGTGQAAHATASHICFTSVRVIPPKEGARSTPVGAQHRVVV